MPEASYIFAFFILILAVKPSWRAMKNISKSINEYAIMPADYSDYFQLYSTEWEGIEVFIPVEGDRGSYDAFPSTPYIQRLEKIELRKEKLSDGFKLKK